MADVFGAEAVSEAVGAFGRYLSAVWPAQVIEGAQGSEWLIELEDVLSDEQCACFEHELNMCLIGLLRCGNSAGPRLCVSVRTLSARADESTPDISLFSAPARAKSILAEQGYLPVRSLEGNFQSRWFVYPFVMAATPRLALEVDVARIRQAIHDLERSVDLCVNVPIDACSIVNAEAGWHQIHVALAARPDVARRLMIEIPEYAQIEPGVGRTFVNRLRQKGCQIAIGGFGLHYGADVLREISYPDWIALDAGHWTGWSDDAALLERLTQVIGLAREMAPAVMMTGAMSEDERRSLARTGLTWWSGPQGRPVLLH
ncbi:hypothetical protein WT49_10205 [Burkholderia territorii]|nr:hypothetical protein WT49_10205 [Burkholderia territorii]KWE41435.1 hypothetical protein WT50_15170 [Burkholderia territorii]KWE41747.1 hypothetical protein WT51_25255 [Burkholderia territorii]